jgi:tRNA dimethylallyltransferase
MNLRKTLIVVAGPTASGKTALAIALAKHFKTVIISADSRQFYKEISIGTAKPSIEEQDGVRHYYVDSHSIHDYFTVAEYEKEVIQLLDELFVENQFVILVGGSGLFVDAVCYGLDDFPSDKNVKQTLNELLEKEGISFLLEELKEKDINYLNRIDSKNPFRVIRALEIMRLSNKTMTDLLIEKKEIIRDFEIQKFIIDLPREILYDRINRRVDEMISYGFQNEVEKVYPFKELQTLNTVGYSEFFSYLDGEIDLNKAIDLMKQNSRRYAKRQLTWFRRDKNSIWLRGQNKMDQFKEIINTIG